MQGGTEIPSKANLNTYLTPGNYFCVSNNVASTINASPFAHAFSMKVEYSQGTGYPRQTVRDFLTGKVATRAYNANGNNTWSDFVYFSDDATLFAGTAIKSGDDLNDYITPGIYYSSSSGVSGTLINIPDENAKTSGFSLLVLPTSEPNGTVSQTIIRGSLSSTIYTRSKNSSGWQPWYKYLGERIES